MKPIPPTTLSHFTDRKTSRTNLTGLKPAEDFFFFPPFLLNSFFLSVFLFYSFFLPSFTFLFLLPALFYLFFKIFVKIPSSFLSPNIFLFLLPSIVPFLFYSLFPSFSSPFFSLSLFPTGETIKPGVLKRSELDCVRPINVSLRLVSTGD